MPWRRLVFLTTVGLCGAGLAAAQFMVVLPALFIGTGTFVTAVCVTVPPSVAALALVGTGGRPDLPYLRTRRGRWIWATAVNAGGTCGTLLLLTLAHGPGEGPALPVLLAGSGLCFALTAAHFAPGARARLTALGVTVLFAACTGSATWAAARPPAPARWLADHHVDHALLVLGTAPAGYTLAGVAATDDEFAATYGQPGRDGTALRLTVRRISYVTERTAANGCPVPVGRRTVCASDGGDRQRVRYGEPDGRGVAVTPTGAVPPAAIDELRLRRAGIVYVVSYDGGGAFDLAAARHVLGTLRPATAEDLATLPGTR